MLFSGPMVRALLEGRKTVTRRLITPQTAYFGSASRLFWDHADLSLAWVDGKGSAEEYLHVPCHRGSAEELDRLDEVWAAKGLPNGYRGQYPDCGPCEVCDYQGWRMTCHRLWARIKRGDRIWVRETFWPAFKPMAGGNNGCVYRADYLRPTMLAPAVYHQKTWTPAIFMPRWASRLTVEVLSVRAERLQDITEEDAAKEGVGTAQFWTAVPGRCAPLMSADCHRAAFAILWGEINGKRAPWESNPIVWRYELALK